MRPFNPEQEALDARRYRILAQIFEQPETMALCERFSILAVLSEEKAKVLKELDAVCPHEDGEHELHQDFLTWSNEKLRKQIGAKEN